MINVIFSANFAGFFSLRYINYNWPQTGNWPQIKKNFQ